MTCKGGNQGMVRNDWILDIHWRKNQYDLLIDQMWHVREEPGMIPRFFVWVVRKMELPSTTVVCRYDCDKSKFGKRISSSVLDMVKFEMPVRHLGWIDNQFNSVKFRGKVWTRDIFCGHQLSIRTTTLEEITKGACEERDKDLGVVPLNWSIKRVLL